MTVGGHRAASLRTGDASSGGSNSTSEHHRVPCSTTDGGGLIDVSRATWIRSLELRSVSTLEEATATPGEEEGRRGGEGREGDTHTERERVPCAISIRRVGEDRGDEHNSTVMGLLQMASRLSHLVRGMRQNRQQ